MKGYELIQKMVDELAHGSAPGFAERAGISQSYVYAAKLRKTEHILKTTLQAIEKSYHIRVIIRDGDYLGWDELERSHVAVDLEQKALLMKAELRAIVEEAEARIEALLRELKKM